MRLLICTALALLAGIAPGARAQTSIDPNANVRPVRIVSAEAREPIRLERVDVRTEIVGRQAQTRVELTLRNPNDRVLEGELQFPLGEGQTLTGFALDIDGEWRPAVPVDKAHGQQVFEDVTRARVDPALLEASQGNQYKLRVYPLPARGTRRVALQLAQLLTTAPGDAAAARFHLPLGFAASAGQLSVELQAAGVPAALLKSSVRGLSARSLVSVPSGEGTTLRIAERDVGNDAELTLSLLRRAHNVVAIQAVGARFYFDADLALPDHGAPRSAPRRISLLWDASGSAAGRDRTREFAVLDAYLKALRDVDVDLIVGRDQVELARRFRVAGGRWAELRQALADTAHDGASNLGALVAAADGDLALLFSDGLANWGPIEMPRPRVALYALSASSGVDAPRLRALAEPAGGRWIDLLQTSASAAARELQWRRTRLVGLSGVNDAVGESHFAVDGRLHVAGWTSDPRTTLRLDFERPDGRSGSEYVVIDARGANAVVGQTAVRVPAADDARTAWVAQRWAQLRIAELDAAPELHRAEIRRLGRAYGLVTRETSLIVLDSAADYARHEIDPPAALRAEVERLLAAQHKRVELSRSAHLNRVAERFARRAAWWQTSYPKDAPPAENKAVARERESDPAAVGELRRAEAVAPMSAPPPSPALAGAAAPAMRAPRQMADAAQRKSASADDLAAAPTSIRLTPWASDSPVARRLRDAAPERVYRVYLDERPDHANSTAFFLDAADTLAAKGSPELALRVLSNLAEMNLENRQVLRVLAYRLLQAGRPEPAIRVLREVLRLSPDEPQSHRDLGLALADAGQWQEAAERLWDVVARPWNARFPDIDQIALAELNALIERAARSGTTVQTAAFDARLLRNLPVDLRITLAWDADNTDIDLWVIDPNGERAYYGHPQTRQGGRMSQDATGGYGPEEFVLRDAKPGRYTVQAQFYGHRQQVLLSATTVMLRLTTGFGRPDQKDELTSLRLNGRSDMVTVGTFEVAR
jgi:tetratricopeptide (TPR) repeat protein